MSEGASGKSSFDFLVCREATCQRSEEIFEGYEVEVDQVSKRVANTVASSIVSTRLDYCNSLLYGTSVRNVQRLQRIQNSLARVVSGIKKRDHKRPVLK